MVMGRRPCKHGVYQQAWGFPLLNIDSKSCVQSVWHHWLHVRCQCFMTRAFWLNLAGGIYWDYYYLLMPLIILHYTTVHERVCLCTHFLRTHLMKELLLECSVQTPLAGVSWAKRRGGAGGGRSPRPTWIYGGCPLQTWSMSKAWYGKSSSILVIVCIYWSNWAQKNILDLHS